MMFATQIIRTMLIVNLKFLEVGLIEDIKYFN